MPVALTLAENLLRRDRLWVALGLVALCLLCWLYLVDGAGTGMSTIAMTSWNFPPGVSQGPAAVSWGKSYWLLMVIMWWIMMIAMMVPSAAPTILLYARVQRHGQRDLPTGQTVIPTSAFLAGYLLAWLAFSVLATALQWLLEQLGLLHGMMMWSTSSLLSAGFLLAAGLYQLSSLKNTCLSHCRSPAEFISRYWRDGQFGALRMGWQHGVYCVGCCWVLMALLFVGGVMNLVWIVGLAVFVLLEKLMPQGAWISRVSGVLMIGASFYLVLAQRLV